MTEKIISKTKKRYKNTKQKILNRYEKTDLKYKKIIYLGIGVLLTSYIAIFLIDLLNIFNSRQILNVLEVPLLWNFLFTENGPIEILQWIFLGGFTITSFFLANKLKKKGKTKEKMFWSIFAVAGILMLIEDIFSLRILISVAILEADKHGVKMIQILIYSLISILPLISLLIYRKKVFQHRTTKILLISGVIIYGSAAFISGPSDLIGTTDRMGNTLYDTTTSIGGEELVEIYDEIDRRVEKGELARLNVRYRLVDYIVEESLELLGAMLLLASSISYKNHINR